MCIRDRYGLCELRLKSPILTKMSPALLPSKAWNSATSSLSIVRSEVSVATKEYKVEELIAFSEAAERGVTDVGSLDKVNCATLLYNLKTRYNKELREIYTYCTGSLLAVNPFKEVPHLMAAEVFSSYQTVILLLT
eukprot:TRINITY_DN16380_c0_g1_i1.p1 TRINITY_DN16380_c0_g1~~TRINITY_DN16380_c0_g1_i1.p1  ORF type:complete len:136 (+),score=17.56 TRINITY_DN16380_c0_g1_i1:67-474(+)